MADDITVYGSDWCPVTQRMLKHLDGTGVPYKYVDIDASPDDEQLIAGWNNGRSIRPSLDVQGDHFVNPDLVELDEDLRRRGLLT